MEILKKLTEKLSNGELVYANEYLEHGNKLKAYAKAYPDDPNPEKTAYSMFKRVGVSAYITERQRQMAEKTTLNQEWVLKQLQENAKLAKAGVESTTTVIKDGEEVSKTTTKKAELANANKATELIGKSMGMFSDGVNITGLDEVVKELRSSGDALASQMASGDDDSDD